MANDAKTVFASTPSTAFGVAGNDVSSIPLGNILTRLSSVTAQNNAMSAQEAATLRTWQEHQNKIAMDFNSREAAANRDWQEYMSNTAHQREVRDLMAAGLNPILSASGGNGASVGSGATASGVSSAGAKGDVDTSGNAALVSLLSSFLQAQTQLQMANMTAINNMAIADKSNASAQIVAGIHRAATEAAARIGADASKYGAKLSSEASNYAADQATYRTVLGIENPNSFYGLLTAIIRGLFGDDDLGSSSGSKSSGVTGAARQVKDTVEDFITNEIIEHGGTVTTLGKNKDIPLSRGAGKELDPSILTGFWVDRKRRRR